MADELRDIVESIRARVQAELEGQLKALTDRHQHTLAEVRRTAEAEGRRAADAEAQQVWSARVQSAREEAKARAQEAVAAVRAELERERAAEINRLRAEAEGRVNEAASRARAEAEQRANEAAMRVRAELEQALAAEREQARVRVEAEQRRASEEIDKTRARVEAEQRRAAEELEKARATFDAVRNADRAAHDAARMALEAQLGAGGAGGPGADRLIDALREIDAADSISATLAAITRAAAKQAGRAAVFVATGEQLREWEVPGRSSLSPAPLYARDTAIGVIGEALRSRQLAHSENGGAPAFAALTRGRAAAAPLLLDGQAVGVLYGDEGNESKAGGGWVAALDVIAAHGSLRLGYLTALRTAQAMRWLNGGGTASVTSEGSASSEEEEQAARRYARLLVSEIKLYNDGAVRVGRENRDLLRRLADEIARARRLFEERVPATVPGRAQLFHNELVQTLAGGDASLLG